MKNKLSHIATVGALAVMLPLATQAETKTYGKIHLNYGQKEVTDQSTPANDEDNWQLNSYASRFGIKGSKQLENNMAITYKLEWEVNPDDDDTKDIEINNRNQYLGLKGGFGEIRAGTHDTPLKMAQGKFDQFGDTLADLKHAGDQDGENRAANVLAYLGKFGNIGFNIAIIPGEGDGTTAGDGPGDSYSASVTFKNGPLYVAVAADSYDDTGAAAGSETDLTRIVATYKMNAMQFGLLLQSGVEKVQGAGNEEDWVGLSFNTKFGGKNKFKVQYIMVEDNAATKREGALLGIGVDHKLDKSTKVYVMYSSLEEELGGTTDLEISSLSAGMVTKF